MGKHGGILVGKGPGVLYDQKKFDTPTFRDFCSIGAIGDVSETAAPWSKLLPLYRNVIAAAEKVYATGRPGLDRHLSHSYHSGACLYFTFAFKHDGVDPLGQYEPLKNAIQQAFVDSGGTLASPRGGHRACRVAGAGHLRARCAHDRGLFSAMDPNSNFNPARSSRSNRLVIKRTKIIQHDQTCDHLVASLAAPELTGPSRGDMLPSCFPMINTHRRSSLPVILASVVLLLAGTGLFLISPTARATTPPPIPPASGQQHSPRRRPTASTVD